MAALMAKKPKDEPKPKQHEEEQGAELGEKSVARALLIQPLGAGGEGAAAAAAAAGNSPLNLVVLRVSRWDCAEGLRGGFSGEGRRRRCIALHAYLRPPVRVRRAEAE